MTPSLVLVYANQGGMGLSASILVQEGSGEWIASDDATVMQMPSATPSQVTVSVHLASMGNIVLTLVLETDGVLSANTLAFVTMVLHVNVRQEHVCVHQGIQVSAVRRGVHQDSMVPTVYKCVCVKMMECASMPPERVFARQDLWEFSVKKVVTVAGMVQAVF